MPILQSLVFPNLLLHASEDMYVRIEGQAWPELDDCRIHFERGGKVSTDTFFNGLTVGTWKRICDIRTLALEIEGSGDYVATIGLHRREQHSIWLAERRISLTPGETLQLELPCWREIQDGMLFLCLRARGTGDLRAGAFVTEDAPVNDVRLGMVITHFNRQPQVHDAVRRIREQLLDVPATGERLTLTVVDNSRNLTIDPHPRIRHVPNVNFGGTG